MSCNDWTICQRILRLLVSSWEECIQSIDHPRRWNIVYCVCLRWKWSVLKSIDHPWRGNIAQTAPSLPFDAWPFPSSHIKLTCQDICLVFLKHIPSSGNRILLTYEMRLSRNFVIFSQHIPWFKNRITSSQSLNMALGRISISDILRESRKA